MQIREHLAYFKVPIPDPDELCSTELKIFIYHWRPKIIEKVGDGQISCLLKNGYRSLTLTFISRNFWSRSLNRCFVNMCREGNGEPQKSVCIQWECAQPD